MNRLDTIRAYFIERFFSLLTSNPEFAGLTEPAELFDSGGTFNVPASISGFVRMPTLEGLRKRIDAATPGQTNALERFERVLKGALEQLFGSLTTAKGSSEQVMKNGCTACIRIDFGRKRGREVRFSSFSEAFSPGLPYWRHTTPHTVATAAGASGTDWSAHR